MSDQLCLKCVEGELQPTEDGRFLQCQSCGFGFHPEVVAAYYSAKPGKDASRDARACFEEQARRDHPSGGGDDGLSVIPDEPWIDDSVVSTKTKVVEKRHKPLRIPGLQATSAEIRRALGFKHFR